MVLKFKLIEKDIASSAIVTFEFEAGEKQKEIYAMESGWRNFEEWQERHPTHPLTYMRKVSDARDWIVHQVVNGNHNATLVLPAQTYGTNNLNEAACLVANDFYLMRLEKPTRLFHFALDADGEARKYRKAEAGTPYYWQSKYLCAFYWLMHCIRKEKLTRQPSA